MGALTIDTRIKLTRAARVVVIGSVNLDLAARVKRLPQPGETVTNADLGRFPGGKGANQALAARRLGADVALLACVGADSAADDALRLLREGGVDLSRCIVAADAPTGVALIAVDENGENQIIGSIKYLEIWDAQAWQSYQETHEENFSAASDDTLRDII
jgi:sugar/nucleoside kinase (ribokinase family)